MHGLLIVDKPAGVTSRRVVDIVRRITGQRKIGHGGTLDPLATGVLVVALGTATRLLEYMIESDKRYRADIILGATSETDDAEGPLHIVDPAPACSSEEIERALASFRGTIVQRPPAFSAVSVGGKRLYALARAGTPVTAPERTIELFALDLLRWETPHLALALHCSKGTYVRSLARDIGTALATDGYLAGLDRTASGFFTRAQAHALAEIERGERPIEQLLLPPIAALAGWPLRRVGTAAAQLRQGKAIAAPPPESGEPPRAAAIDDSGVLVAVMCWLPDIALWQPMKVLAESPHG